MIKTLLSKISSALIGRQKFILFKINDRIKPIDRSITYTEPLEAFLNSKNWGEVLNEGTFLQKNGEISACDIHIKLTSKANNEICINQISSFLEELGMPKGSTLIIEKTNKRLSVGRMEGLGLYFTKDFVSNSRLSTQEVEKFAETLHNTVGHTNSVDRSWSSDEEDAAYFYNKSFYQMQSKVEDLLIQFNITRFARIVQIA